MPTAVASGRTSALLANVKVQPVTGTWPPRHCGRASPEDHRHAGSRRHESHPGRPTGFPQALPVEPARLPQHRRGGRATHGPRRAMEPRRLPGEKGGAHVGLLDVDSGSRYPMLRSVEDIADSCPSPGLGQGAYIDIVRPRRAMVSREAPPLLRRWGNSRWSSHDTAEALIVDHCLRPRVRTSASEGCRRGPTHPS